ncbi:hypothetical protein, partial [Mesorhizobium sp. M8A.F.Ca.ET.213.01.1.1]|uniref:hypothetical protein n=1 Tax=Mesorhizobium sp. M8A.F.Ca.ET.213.01.1.1 TaxID=2563970 RepID=UPI001AED15E8
DSEGKLKESTKKATAMKKAVPAAVTTTTLPQLVGDKSMRILLLPLRQAILRREGKRNPNISFAFLERG